MSDPTSDAAQSPHGINGANGATARVEPAQSLLTLPSEETMRQLASIAAGAPVAEGATTVGQAPPQPPPPPVMPALPPQPARPVALTPGIEEAMRAEEARAAAAAAATTASAAPAAPRPPPLAPTDPSARPDAAGVLTVARHDLWDTIPPGWQALPPPPYFWSPYLAARDFDCAPLVGILLAAVERKNERGISGVLLRFMNVRPLPATRGPADDRAVMIGANNIVIVECTYDLERLIEAARDPRVVCELHLKPEIDEVGRVTVRPHVGRRDIKRDLFEQQMRRLVGGAPAQAAAQAQQAQQAQAAAQPTQQVQAPARAPGK